MADEKISALVASSTLAANDLFVVVNDVSTTPVTKKVERQNVYVNKILESSGPTVLSVGAIADGQYLTRSGSTIVGGLGPVGKNFLDNPNFAVAQRGTSFTSATTPANSDDTYLLDRWVLLSDGNDIVDVSQETSGTISEPLYNIKLDVETANKKFGILQIIENKNARQMTNKAVSLSFSAKVTGTTINAIRAAIISWSSTADAVTSDVVSAWGAAGTNPTLATNWTYENTPAALTAPTTSWQEYTIENISIDTAATTNVAVFIWTDDVTMTIGDFLHIKDVKLEIGSTATDFEYLPYSENLRACQRRCEKIANIDTYTLFAFGLAKSTTQAQFLVEFKTQKASIPTLSFSAGSTFILTDGVTNTAGSSIAAIAALYSTNGAAVQVTVASGLTQYRPMQVSANNQSAGNAWIMAECEL